MPDPYPITSLADFADGVTVVPFHPRLAQWVKDRMKPLATVTHRHATVSCSHVQHVQYVVWRCPAGM